MQSGSLRKSNRPFGVYNPGAQIGRRHTCGWFAPIDS